MRHSAIVVVCGMLAQVVLCAGVSVTGQSPVQYSFAGRITDIAGGQIDHAIVRIERLGGEPGSVVVHAERGTYVVPPLPDGDYSLEATAPGFLTVKHYPLRVRFPNVFEFDFHLHVGVVVEGGVGEVDPYCRFFGTLRRQGSAIANAEVCLRQSQQKRCSVANTLGQYFVQTLPGVYDVEVAENGVIVFSSRMDLGTPAEYRDRIVLK